MRIRRKKKYFVFSFHDSFNFYKNHRISDVRSKSEVKSIPLDVSATSLEISADGNTLTAAHGNTVTFWDLAS